MLERMYGITPREELPPPQVEVPALGVKILEADEEFGRFVAEKKGNDWILTKSHSKRSDKRNEKEDTQNDVQAIITIGNE